MALELGDWQKTAWEALLFAHANRTSTIDGRLAVRKAPSIEVYDVLLVLDEAPDKRLKMSDLASRLLMTRSGVTRLVDRLAKSGLVSRLSCAEDRRVVYAQLTSKGAAHRVKSWPPYREAIAQTFGSKLSADEARSLSRLLARFVPEGHPMLNVGLKHPIGS